KRGGEVGFFIFPPRVFSTALVAPAIFSACHRVIFFASARVMTPCTFIAHSIAGLRVRQHTVHALLLHRRKADIACPISTGTFHGSTALAVSLACSRGTS